MTDERTDMFWVKTAAAVATGVLATGAAVTGVGAATQADASTTAVASTTLHCHPAKKLPTRLVADLRAARALPAGSRGPALHTIRDKALHGDYGARAERWAQHRLVHRGEVLARMPQQMRQDLRAVHRLPATQRPAARKAIRAKALDGGYGATAQKRAEDVQAHRAACRAQKAA